MIKTIDLGPFKQKQDQGLPVRKLTFDTLEVRFACMLTLFTRCSMGCDLHIYMRLCSNKCTTPSDALFACALDKWRHDSLLQ